jgi:hypothetical protein
MSDGTPAATRTKETVRQQQPSAPVLQGPETLIEQLPLLTPGVQRAVLDPGRAQPADILALQRVAGNRAVSRLIQTKLAVGPPGDRYEQEADRVAEQVVGQQSAISSQQSAVQRQEAEAVQAKPLTATLTPLVQRQEDEEEVQMKPLLQRQEEEDGLQAKPLLQRQEEEEEVQAKPLATAITPLVRRQEEEEEEVQMKPRADGSFEASTDLEQRLAGQKGGGSPLPDEVRTFMEPRFGADFSGVRLHTGGEAAQLSRDLSAQAFTHGQDIYLGVGRFEPGTDAGKHLLAHELTHVVQQTGHVQRVETDQGGTPTVAPASVQLQGNEEQVQTKPSPDAHRGPTLAASITAMGRADGIQRVPLFAGSQIDYDPTPPNPHLTWGGFSKNITVPDYNTLSAAIASLIANRVDPTSIEKQMTKYLDIGGVGHRESILRFDLVAKQIALVAAHLPTVDARRQADEAILREGPAGANPPIMAGPSLLAPGDNFQAYELAGADPHKGGEIPLFLRYQTAGGEIKKIVYKPADLTPERVLFGGHEFSVAQFGGTYAHAIAAGGGGGGVGGVYSYMTFIEEEGPRNAADVASIYRSLGEGLALGYVYGLRDLHHENYMLRRDHIQWIDLEAMTATFDSMAQMDILRLFGSIGQKMVNVLRLGIEPGPDQWFRQLRRRTNRRNLIADLQRIDFATEIRTGFNSKRASIPVTAPQAAQWVTRFVPFATEQLYGLVSLWHDQPEMASPVWPPVAWVGTLRAAWPAWFDQGLNGLTYDGPRAEVEPLMTAPRTRAAIARGDIPFFLRRGDAILDEQGQVIIPISQHPRVPRSRTVGQTAEWQAATDIQARQTGPVPANLLDYPINMVRGMHTRLINDLSQ